MTALPPQRRDLAMVFQSYALYPHKSVRENLAFGLRMRGVAAADRARASRRGSRPSDHAVSTRPSQLSGGQRQRVAFGRAIVREPRHSSSTSRSRTSIRAARENARRARAAAPAASAPPWST